MAKAQNLAIKKCFQDISHLRKCLDKNDQGGQGVFLLKSKLIEAQFLKELMFSFKALDFSSDFSAKDGRGSDAEFCIKEWVYMGKFTSFSFFLPIQI